MRAQARRRVAIGDRRSREPDGITNHPDRRPALRQVLFDDELTRNDVRIGEDLVYFVDRAGGNKLGIEQAEQFEFPEAPDSTAQNICELTAIANAVGILLETRIRR